MKCAVQLVKCISAVMFCTVSMLSCEKDPDVGEDPNDPGDSTNVDTISNHLRFYGATKVPGTIPSGPAASTLKISIEDTIYLMDKVKRAIKFLHMGATKNVAGIYLQVHTSTGGTGGNFATYHYNVPEVPDMANSDTVSVIMIGIEPAGLEAPIVFDVTITPYDETGQPIAKAIRPVKMIAKADVSNNTGPCDLINLPGEHWLWELSHIENPDGTLSFYNDPNEIWGSKGQTIRGSCCNGNSFYGICPGDSVPNSSLHFNTFFMYPGETFKFLENGTFVRTTIQLTNNPAPTESNFCGLGEGVVHEKRIDVTYTGNWTLNATTKNLQLQTTFSTGFGWGNPGGIIHQLDCSALVMIQGNNEGQNSDLVKFYNRMSATGITWYPFE